MKASADDILPPAPTADSDLRVSPRIGILILNYNGRAWLEELLPTLVRHADEGSTVYLVDNDSTDDSVPFFRRALPGGVVIALGVNCGYSPAYNVAIDTAYRAGCDWVCLLNNDTRVTEDWLAPIRRAALSDPRIGIIGPAFREWRAEGPNAFFRARYASLTASFGQPVVTDVDWVEGSAMFIRRETWQDVGPFDPDYFIFWDEVDYCRRARRRSWRVVIACDSLVEHYGGGSVHSDSAFRKPLMALNLYAFMLTAPHTSFMRNVLRWLRHLASEMLALARKRDMSLIPGWLSRIVTTVGRLPALHARHRRLARGERMPHTNGQFAASFTDRTRAPASIS